MGPSRAGSYCPLPPGFLLHSQRQEANETDVSFFDVIRSYMKKCFSSEKVDRVGKAVFISGES